MNACQKFALFLFTLLVAAVAALFTVSATLNVKICLAVMMLIGLALVYALGSWIIDAHEFQQWHRREIERLQRQLFGRPVNFTSGRGDTWSGPRE